MKSGKEFAEKMFSEMENEVQERLYSTGNDELDDLLERAFCEGYEYAQREFATGIDKLSMGSLRTIIKAGQGKGKQAARKVNAVNKRLKGNSKEQLAKFGRRASMRNQKEGTEIMMDALKVNDTTAKRGVTEMAKNLGPDRAHKLKGYQQRKAAGLI